MDGALHGELARGGSARACCSVEAEILHKEGSSAEGQGRGQSRGSGRVDAVTWMERRKNEGASARDERASEREGGEVSWMRERETGRERY